MDWDDLKVFRAVASAGSLAGGARRVAVSQATAWRRIRALEGALHVALFDRRPTGYVLTPAGTALLGTAEDVARAIDGVRGQVTDVADDIAGEVRVAAPEFVGAMLATALPDIARRHPRLVVELLTGSPAAGLLVRDVDIAIRAERTGGTGFTLEGVFAIPFALYASPALPATPRRATRHRRSRAVTGWSPSTIRWRTSRPSRGCAAAAAARASSFAATARMRGCAQRRMVSALRCCPSRWRPLPADCAARCRRRPWGVST